VGHDIYSNKFRYRPKSGGDMRLVFWKNGVQRLNSN
jgi:hypothetical protein